MAACEQAPGQTMLQHGEAVHAAYLALSQDLENENAHLRYKELVPLWQELKGHIPPADVLKRYHIYHDCGKHLCLEPGEDGKRRYPNHAEISAQQYASLFPEDTLTQSLIRRDMDFHTLRGDELVKLWESPFAPTLYFTAWAEINANAAMFGGMESESYKIKRSRLIQAGKKSAIVRNALKGAKTDTKIEHPSGAAHVPVSTQGHVAPVVICT